MVCELQKCLFSHFSQPQQRFHQKEELTLLGVCVGMCEDRHHEHCSEIYCISDEICDLIEYKCKKHCTEKSHDHCSKANCTKPTKTLEKSAELIVDELFGVNSSDLFKKLTQTCDDNLCTSHCVKIGCSNTRNHCCKILCDSENICDTENSLCVYHCEKVENHNIAGHCKYKFCMNLIFKNELCTNHYNISTKLKK